MTDKANQSPAPAPAELPHFRDLWNKQHNTNLQAHDDTLSPKEVNQINSHFEIEIYVGWHGQREFAWPSGARPTPVEYDVVGDVIESMQPGDVLFVEQAGFQSQRNDSGISTAPSTKYDRGQVEQARKAGVIDAFDYGFLLARLKGVPIVFADLDAFEMNSFESLSGERELRDLIYEDDRAAPIIHSRRERKARNTMKDWALAHVDEAAGSQDHKPRLVLLFGGAHQEGLQQAFDEIGLDTKLTVLEQTGR